MASSGGFGSGPGGPGRSLPQKIYGGHQPRITRRAPPSSGSDMVELTNAFVSHVFLPCQSLLTCYKPLQQHPLGSGLLSPCPWLGQPAHCNVSFTSNIW
jgi:hypothetical protein